MASLQLPPSIRDLRGQAIEQIASRAARIDLTPLLVYRIDSVPDSVLPWLAWQFDISSALWLLIAASGDPRELIKTAIPMHRRSGVPGTIKKALAALGWPNATILEGQDSWGGSSYPSNQGWAVCRIQIPLPPVNVAAIAPWDATKNYPRGSMVTYNGLYFYATAPSAVGNVPQFGAFYPTDWSRLSELYHLVQIPWVLVILSGGVISPTSEDAANIAAAFEFFKPARCLLDAVVFVYPASTDSAPAPVDRLTFGGSLDSAQDLVPPPADAIVYTLELAPMTENYPAVVPLQNKHFFQKGHNQGANEPLVADGPLVVNGVIHGESE